MTPEQIAKARDDADFIAAARTGWPEALEEIERLNMELAEVKKWLQGQAILLQELRK